MYVKHYTVLSDGTNLINVLTKVYSFAIVQEYQIKRKQMTTKIVKVSTPEVNVTDRTITYDLYVNDVYVSTFSDICDAMDVKDSYK